MKHHCPWWKRILETIGFIIVFLISAPLVLLAGSLIMVLLLIVGILFFIFWDGEDPTNYHTHVW